MILFTFNRVFCVQERRKDLTDHRNDSTFSFDPSKINIKTLTKDNQKKIDARKGVLLSSYTRKKTRRRKRDRSSIGQKKNDDAHSRFLCLFCSYDRLFPGSICHGHYVIRHACRPGNLLSHMNKMGLSVSFNWEWNAKYQAYQSSCLRSKLKPLFCEKETNKLEFTANYIK